jgi:signal transduction histidine kinase
VLRNAQREELRVLPPGYGTSSQGVTRLSPSLATLARVRATTVSRWRQQEVLRDVGLAVVVFAASAAVLAGRGGMDDTRELDLLGVLLAGLASLPLVAWRRAPLAVFVATAAASAALNAIGYAPGPPFGPTVALFLLALHPERTRLSRPATGAVVLGVFAVHVGTVAVAEDAFPTVALLFGALVWGGALVAGDRVRQRRARMHELEERARRAEREAERERRLAAAEERTRIARDLHDSAGHAINVILVQAGAARLLSEQDPERSQAALETIEDVARGTLGEIDQLVRALREDDPDGVEPPPGLAALGDLTELHRTAGLAVSLNERGSPRPLSPGLDQAAYRILQEALTNAARHGAGSAAVEVRFDPSALELEVTNPIRPGSAQPEAGHGITGMRERATLLGGRLDAAASDGSFSVRVYLPYGGGSE